MVLDTVSYGTAGLVAGLTGAIVVAIRLASPGVDPSEPPLLKPRVPILGHLIAMMREKAGFYRRLHDESHLSIATLPILNGKVYVLNSPALYQAAMRSPDISFDPFLVEFTQPTFGLSDRLVEIISRPDVLESMLSVIKETMMGEPMLRTSLAALRPLMDILNGIESGEPLIVSDTMSWMKRDFTVATAIALFGEENPLTAEHIHHLWTFDEGSTALAMGIAPSLLAPDAISSRDALAKVLTAYYTAKLDQRDDVSAIIQQRAALSRKSGFDNADLGAQELLIPWVATTNTIPTFFWLFSVVFSNPEYATRVRDEAVALASITDSPDGGRLAELPVGQLETRCPFLHACYQEVLRLYLNGVGNRRVMRDTRLHDADGRPYLLKKGVNVQVPSGVLHTLGSAWGPDARDFRPERWLDASPQQERSRRGAFMPFGGGRHLCPGRRFARGEILGFMAVVAAGFEVQGVELPQSTDPSIGTLSRPPVWESTRRGVTIRRREEWEDVTWTFIS